jgi:hypothetical protein
MDFTNSDMILFNFYACITFSSTVGVYLSGALHGKGHSLAAKYTRLSGTNTLAYLA